MKQECLTTVKTVELLHVTIQKISYGNAAENAARVENNTAPCWKTCDIELYGRLVNGDAFAKDLEGRLEI